MHCHHHMPKARIESPFRVVRFRDVPWDGALEVEWKIYKPTLKNSWATVGGSSSPACFNLQAPNKPLVMESENNKMKMKMNPWGKYCESHITAGFFFSLQTLLFFMFQGNYQLTRNGICSLPLFPKQQSSLQSKKKRCFGCSYLFFFN